MSKEIYETKNSKVNVIKEGHVYEVVIASGAVPINFQDGAVKEVGGRNGFQNEELLAILIDRMKFLNTAFPCTENQLAIFRLESALDALESRTANREARGVEGENKA